MIRLSACFSVPLDIIEPCGFPLSIKTLRRSAMDYADIADLLRHDSWDSFQAQRGAGRLVLMTTKAEASIWDFRFHPDDTIMVGRESAGVPDAVAQACDRGETTREDAAGAILYAAENATRIALDAIQLLGGNGYINEYPTGRPLRDAKLYEIGAGTSEIRRMLIGRELFLNK